MQKAIGMLILVMAVWTGIELATNGTAGAFGGAFASFVDEDERDAEYKWAGERAGEKLRAQNEDREEAINRLTGN